MIGSLEAEGLKTHTKREILGNLDAALETRTEMKRAQDGKRTRKKDAARCEELRTISVSSRTFF